MRTQVGIVGAGPAGLLLAHLLARDGIESVVVEARSRAYCEARIRAGVIEDGIAQLLVDSGVGERLHREGMRHGGIYLQWPGERHHVDFDALCGHAVWVYGQTEVVKDLIGARLASGQALHFEVEGTSVHDVDTERPSIRFTDADGTAQVLECDVVAGCDGFHGVSRSMVPAGLQTSWERTYPFAWLGILAEVAPSTDELIYAWHPRGFAMHSMRSTSISRLYLQVDPGERLEDWSDDRVWTELSTRLHQDGWTLHDGPVLDKSITPMRSFVSTPMRYGRLAAGRRCRSHRPADRRQGPQPRVGGRRAAGRGAGRPAARRRRAGPRRVLRDRGAPGMAQDALLVVDDLDAAHVRRHVRCPAAAVAAAVHLHLDGRGDRSRRELHRRRAGPQLSRRTP